MAVEDVGVRLKLAGKQKFSGDMKGAAGDVKNLGDKADQASEKARRSADRWKKFGKIAGVGAAAGVVALGAAAAGGVRSLMRIEQITAQTNAAIKSTGAAAGVSAGQIVALGSSIEAATGIEQESIQEGQNLLLTFTKIKNGVGEGNDVFDQATKSLVDMSVALGTDVSGSALQLGKALNDPLKGITSLSRAGVSFTQQQKDQVKAMVAAGDTLGAQKLILAELQTQFGGSAEAFGETTAGKVARFQHAIGSLQETLATALMPAMERVSVWLTTDGVPMLERFGAWFSGEGSQSLKDFASDAAAKVMTAVRAVGDAFDWAKKNAEWLTPVVSGLAATMVTLSIANTIVGFYRAWAAATVAQTTAQWLLNGALLANPIGLVIAVIAGLVAGIVIAYKRSETFRDIMNGAFRTIAEGAFQMVDGVLAGIQWLMEGLGKLPGPLGAPFRSAAGQIEDARGKLDELAGRVDNFGRKTASPTIRLAGVGVVEEQLVRLERRITNIGGVQVRLPVSMGPDNSTRGGFRAAGGPVTAGRPYVVGELRPEVFVPNVSGRILPRVTPAAMRSGVSLARPAMPEGATVGGDGGALLGSDRPIIVRIDVDGRTIAEAQAEAVADRRARR